MIFGSLFLISSASINKKIYLKTPCNELIEQRTIFYLMAWGRKGKLEIFDSNRRIRKKNLYGRTSEWKYEINRALDTVVVSFHGSSTTLINYNHYKFIDIYIAEDNKVTLIAKPRMCIPR